MSNKSRRPSRPHTTTFAPVLSLDAATALLAGKEPPRCCGKHRQEYEAIKAVVHADAAGAPCLLCGAPSALRGAFIPHDAQKYGAAPGKRRLLFYPICTDCWTLPNREALVEQWALASVRQGMAQAKAAWN
jgi:hypothetical protein